MVFIYALMFSAFLGLTFLVFSIIEENVKNLYKEKNLKQDSSNQKEINTIYFYEKEGKIVVDPCSLERGHSISKSSLAKGIMLALTIRDQEESYPISIFLKQDNDDGTIYKVFQEPSNEYKVPGVETDFNANEKLVIETADSAVLESLKNTFFRGKKPGVKDRFVWMD